MKKYFYVLTLILTGMACYSQDVNFSQYFNMGMNLNPAIIAADDYVGFTGLYRQTDFVQNVTSNSTYLMLDRPLYNSDKRYGGVGFSIVSDHGGGNLPIKYEGANFAYAHNLKISQKSFLSLGLQAGYYQRKLDYSDFSTGSQWIDGNGYNGSLNNGEVYDDLSATGFELSSGLLWYIPIADNDYKAYLGISMYNLNKPDYSFFGSESQVPLRYMLSGAYQFFEKNKLSFIPQALWYNTYNQNYVDVGMIWKYKFERLKTSNIIGKGSVDLYTFYHVNRGLMTGIGINQDRFTFSISYDFGNFSDNDVPNNGTFEISFCVKKFVAPDSRKRNNSQDYVSVKREFLKEPAKVENTTKTKEPVVKERTSDREVKFRLEQDFQFAFNAAELNDDAKTYLDDLIILLNDNESLKIEIIGHTDNVGTLEANQLISERRANNVRKYLVEKGIEENRIMIVAKANQEPKYDNNTGKGRAMNRRVEFIIYY
jgi:type IX secretion system PorP/SprF family membrane protein